MSKSSFKDGLRNFVSSLWNSRTAIAENCIIATKVSTAEMREIYRTGLGNKVVRIKAGYALRDTLQFASKEDELYYNARLKRKVAQAARWSIAFGRGIIVLHQRGDILSKPLGEVDPNTVLLSVFSGDMITTGDVDRDLQSPRYYKPIQYTVRGETVHYTRVVDFTYVEPPEFDAPAYMYGGIGEFELIYDQLIADGVVQRASPRILDKASTLFYKVRGFKDAMKNGAESDMVSYFQQLESIRGIMAAGLMDQEDELEVVTQTLTNLADADQITLRRLAMVTGIPLAILVGESVKGLNSTGDSERQVFQDMIYTLQEEYLETPINRVMKLCGQGLVSFKENQGETPNNRIDYETKAIANARSLYEMGEDHVTYLQDKDIIQPDEFDNMFKGD